MKSTYLRSAAVAAFLSAGAVSAQADNLTLYCAADEAWCQQMARGLRGRDRHHRRHDAQELRRDLRPGARRGGEPEGRHLVGRHRRPASAGRRGGADGGVRLAHDGRAARLGDQAGRGRRQQRTVGVYSGALGFGYNKDLLAKNNLPEPKCWADLIKPEFKGHIQIANPNSSGTAYTMLATMVQLMGEDEGLRVPEGAPRQRQPVHQVRLGPDQGRGPRRDHGRHRLPARRRGAGGGRLPDRAGRALRGHRLRDRLDVDHRGRPQRGAGEEVLRLGAHRRGAVAGAGR